MIGKTYSRSGFRLLCGMVVAAMGGGGLVGCVEPPTGACCDPDEACSVVTEAACTEAGGTYQGDDTDCSTNSICEDEFVVFRYSGGECPPEMVIKDGNPANVECGVPRSRLFDENSPLDGSMADSGTGGFGTYPDVDDPADTGMLVRLDNFAVDTNGLRRNIVVICFNIIIPPQAGSRRAVRCTITRAAGFELTPEAQAVVNGGRRNYWAQQARKLAKAEADAAGGVDPGAARRADRLRRVFNRKNNTDYDALADGTRYMPEVTEMTERIEIIPPSPGAIFSIYLVFVGDAFDSLGQFITDIEFTLTKEAGSGSPMLGDITENALVFESIDELGPVTVVDYTDGLFTPNAVDLTQADSMNPRNAIWIANSSDNLITLDVPGHPSTMLPPDNEVAFDDLLDGQITATNAEVTTLDINAGAQALACCIDNACNEDFASTEECEDAGGTAFANTLCAEAPCEPATDPWEDALGNYTLQGNCPGNGQNVAITQIDSELFLQGLPENDDILLDCDGDSATADNVTAFDVAGHDLTLTITPTGLNLLLFQPDTLGSCGSQLVPQ